MSNPAYVPHPQDTPISIWHNDQPRDFEPHWHLALEIIMPLENWYDAAVNGSDYHLVPGDILFIPPGELHSIKAPESGKRLVFLFDLSAFENLRNFTGVLSVLAKPLLLNQRSYPGIYEDVSGLLLRMKNEYFSRNEFADLTIWSDLLTLLVKLGTHHLDGIDLFSNMREYKQKEYMEKFSSVMNYIDSHYMEELDMESIARSVGFSKYHFARLFKQFTHYTFCAYINHRRIRATEELLLQPDLSITEIALQSGFPSISTFNRVFKQQTGCTPTEYREKSNHYRKYR